jgi:hypothetical protein
MRYWGWYSAASIVALIIALIVRSYWAITPTIGYCALCWALITIAVIFKIKESMGLKYGKIDIFSHIVLLFGIFLNAMVTLSNSGYMPVYPCPYFEIIPYAMWTLANTSHNLLYLSDRFIFAVDSLYVNVSVGDLVIFFSLIMMFISWIAHKRYKFMYTVGEKEYENCSSY